MTYSISVHYGKGKQVGNIESFKRYDVMRHHDLRDPGTMMIEIAKAKQSKRKFNIDRSKSHQNIELVEEIPLKKYIYNEIELSMLRHDEELRAKNEKHSSRYYFADLKGRPKYETEEDRIKIIEKEINSQLRKNGKDVCLCVPGILQIGNSKTTGYPDPEIIETIAKDYLRKYEEKYGMKVIAASLHLDETGPHVHFYTACMYDRDRLASVRNKTGKGQVRGIDRRIGLTGCLECAGFTNDAVIEIEDELTGQKKTIKDRNKNARAQFSIDSKDLFVEVCKEHGVDVSYNKGAGGSGDDMHTYQKKQDQEKEFKEKDRQIEEKEFKLNQIRSDITKEEHHLSVIQNKNERMEKEFTDKKEKLTESLSTIQNATREAQEAHKRRLKELEEEYKKKYEEYQKRLPDVSYQQFLDETISERSKELYKAQREAKYTFEMVSTGECTKEDLDKALEKVELAQEEYDDSLSVRSELPTLNEMKAEIERGLEEEYKTKEEALIKENEVLKKELNETKEVLKYTKNSDEFKEANKFIQHLFSKFNTILDKIKKEFSIHKTYEKTLEDWAEVFDEYALKGERVPDETYITAMKEIYAKKKEYGIWEQKEYGVIKRMAKDPTGEKITDVDGMIKMMNMAKKFEEKHKDLLEEDDFELD